MARAYQRFSRSTVPALWGLFVAWQFFPADFPAAIRLARVDAERVDAVAPQVETRS